MAEAALRERNGRFGEGRRHQVDCRTQKIARLEAKLAQQNKVLAEMMQDHVELKKEVGEL
jgi:hypothetical protein